MQRGPTLWWWDDWERDTRCLSVKAAGGWIRLLNELDRGPLRGQATYLIEAWAAIMGCDKVTGESILSELKRAKVARVTLRHEKITIMSRRMVRERKARELDAKRARKYRKHLASRSRPRPSPNTQRTQQIQQIRTHPKTQVGETDENSSKNSMARQEELGALGGENNGLATARQALADITGDTRFDAIALLKRCGMENSAAVFLTRHRSMGRIREVVRWALDLVPPSKNLAGVIRTALEGSGRRRAHDCC